jgi:hypothetical protein
VTASGTFSPVIDSRNLASVDCTSTRRRAFDDIDAFSHGFASISSIDAN